MAVVIDPSEVDAILDALITSRKRRDRERKRVVVGRVIGRGYDWLEPYDSQIREAFASAGRAGCSGSWEVADYQDDATLNALYERGYDGAWDHARWEDHEVSDGDCGHIDGLSEAIDRLTALIGEGSDARA